jgi:hypothetical protein
MLPISTEEYPEKFRVFPVSEDEKFVHWCPDVFPPTPAAMALITKATQTQAIIRIVSITASRT